MIYCMSYVITGNPGVGKHTISKEISKILNLPIIDINQIAKESDLLEKKEETHDVDVIKLSKLLQEKIIQPSIIVGHLAPYVLEPKKITKVLVFRKNPYDLIPIYKERNYSKEKIKDNLGSEVLGVIFYDSISKFGQKKTIQLDVTNQSIEESVKKSIDAVNEKIQPDDVDWLTIISEKKDLEQFFAY